LSAGLCAPHLKLSHDIHPSASSSRFQLISAVMPLE